MLNKPIKKVGKLMLYTLFLINENDVEFYIILLTHL